MPRRIEVAFHLVDARNWASVRSRGLLSASRLMTLAGETASIREHRPRELRLSDVAVVRDQSPMPPAALARSLRDGLTPADWYALLNGKVFFWLDPDRLDRQRLACGSKPQVVIAFDVQALLSAHGSRASVTPFNTGYAMRAAAPRGTSTFVPYDRWVAEGWTDERSSPGSPRPAGHRPVELTIEDAVPDALRFATGTVTLGAGETLSSLRGSGVSWSAPWGPRGQPVDD